MKVLAVLAVLCIGAFAAPHDHVNGQRWAMVPDGNGQLHLVDLEAKLQPENFFNAANDVVFRLFTRRNPTTPQVIAINNAASLSNSNFNRAHPTRFIVHGWNNDGASPVNTIIRTAYMNRGEFNVITVDWGVGANTINYISARNRVNEVGPLVAQFIDFLANSGSMSFNTISVIGHSLGGHIAGITGKRVARGRLHTVVALDPALPLFSIDRPLERVAASDAGYVEIIHSNAGLLGFDEPIGDADFYPNGGRTQPGCGSDVAGTCAHGRAFEFFAESIASNSVGFWSRQCRNYGEILNNNCVSAGNNRPMGSEPSNSGSARGVYWLETNAASPFARGPM